jgi:hypothetical protein
LSVKNSNSLNFLPFFTCTCNQNLANVLTVTGGQHFSATAQESLQQFPEIDVIVRGEGEQTLAELVKTYQAKSDFTIISGISNWHGDTFAHNPSRPQIENLVCFVSIVAVGKDAAT